MGLRRWIAAAAFVVASPWSLRGSAYAQASPAPTVTAPETSPAADEAWQVRVASTSLRLGIDRSTHVEVRGPDVPITALDLRASVGSLRDVTRTGRGVFTARYDVPTAHAPDIALITVRSESSPVPGVAAITLAGRYRLTVDVEPNARVLVQLADGTSERAIAPRSGSLELVMHVAPGIDRARVQATDANGNMVERVEPIDVPPLHRLALLRAPNGVDNARTLRWFVAGASADGQLLEAVPEFIEVTGALGALTLRRPGVVEVAVTPPRRVETSTIDVDVHERNVALDPSHDVVVVAGNRPAALRLSGPEHVRVGEIAVFRLTVFDDAGNPLSGLADRLVARVNGRDAAIEDAGASVRVVVDGLERTGPAELGVRLPVDGSQPLEAHRAVRVDPGAPSRLDVTFDHPLRVGLVRHMVVRARDRFGNSTPLRHPSITASDAVVRDVVALADGGVTATIEAREIAPRLTVDADYDVHRLIDLHAQSSPESVGVLTAATTVRTNFGPALFLGGRIRFVTRFAFRPAWDVLAGFDSGLEGASLGDALGNAASVLVIPSTVRVGIQRRFGIWRVGVLAGGVFRAVRASVDYQDGTTTTDWTLSPGVSASVLLRAFTAAGVISLDLGAESGWLDTAHARGTLGGLQASLGWGIAL